MKRYKEKKEEQYFVDTQYWGEQSVISKKDLEKILDKNDMSDIIRLVDKEEGLRWNNVSDYSLRVGAWLDPRNGKIVTGTSKQNSTGILDAYGILLFNISPNWSEISDDDLLGNSYNTVTIPLEYLDEVLKDLSKASREDIDDLKEYIEVYKNKVTLYYNSIIDIEDWFDIVVEPFEGISYDNAFDEVVDYYVFEEAKDNQFNWYSQVDSLYENVYYYDEEGEKVYPY